MFLKINEQNKDLFVQEVFEQLSNTAIKSEKDVESILLFAKNKLDEHTIQKQAEIESHNLCLSNHDAICEIKKENNITIEFSYLETLTTQTKELIKLYMSKDDYYEHEMNNDFISLDFNERFTPYDIKSISALVATSEWKHINLYNRKNPISGSFIRIYPLK